jgi:hypothetical protein
MLNIGDFKYFKQVFEKTNICLYQDTTNLIYNLSKTPKGILYIILMVFKGG